MATLWRDLRSPAEFRFTPVPSDFVEVDDLTKTFPVTLGFVPWLRNAGRVQRQTALEGVSFGVRRGELFGLLGPNGAGKSTILRIIAGLVIADSGAVRVDGIDTRSAPLAVRRKVSLCCTDDRSFYYRLSARRNLEYFGALAGLYGARLRERISEVVRLVDLSGDLDRRFDTFSSGMKQRLGIARALLGDPELLILDEPTRAVDPAHAASIRAFVRDELVARQGKTVLLATNTLEEAWELCGRIAVLRRGHVVAIAPPSALDARAIGPVRYEITVDRTDEQLLDTHASCARTDGFGRRKRRRARSFKRPLRLRSARIDRAAARGQHERRLRLCNPSARASAGRNLRRPGFGPLRCWLTSRRTPEKCGRPFCGTRG